VKIKAYGQEGPGKEERGQRVSKWMNHQFYHAIPDWEENHDKMIMAKNILGTVHKKYWYDGNKVRCALRRSGVVINNQVEYTHEAPRISDEIELVWWQVEERVRRKEWRKIEVSDGAVGDFAEEDKPAMYIEQIRREDMDGDGYPEPYIVTVHLESKQVVRITPNYTFDSIVFDGIDFDALEYSEMQPAEQEALKEQLKVVEFDENKARVRYIKYDMIHSWEGGYWGVGFGHLLGPLNENCNKLVNQLLNAGHLATNGGGFINAGIKMKAGTLNFKNNEWKVVNSYGQDLARNIVPMPVKEPSATLFSLLGLLMETLREVSSVTEVMSGEQPHANMAASSVSMLIEQGKKLFNSVYKRHFRALTREFDALYDLTYQFVDAEAYGNFIEPMMRDQKGEKVPMPQDQWLALAKGDFERDKIDIQPTANPEFSSRQQRMVQGQALLPLKDDPRVNGVEVLRRFVHGVVDDHEVADHIIPEQPAMTPEQMMQQIQLGVQKQLGEYAAKQAEHEAEKAKWNAMAAQTTAQKTALTAPAAVEVKRLGIEKAQVSLEKEEVALAAEKADFIFDEDTGQLNAAG
jgi:chaperonin GroES